MSEKNANNLSEVIKLDFPIQLADRMLNEVTMRRIKVGDLIDCPIANMQDLQGETKLIGRLSGIKEDEIRAMDAIDYVKCERVMYRFRFGNSNTPTNNEDDASNP